MTFAGDVADIAALIRALGFESVDVYGFSYGGMVAQALALDHPALVRRLILANTLHSPEMWQKNHENINREIELQYPEVWERILELRAQGVRSTDPRVQDLYRVHAKLVRFYNPDNAAKLLSEPGARNAELYPVFVGDDVEFFIGGEVAKLPDFRPRLHELRMPTMILAGRYDRALYPKYQYEFKRFAPQADFVWMERSGTFSHIRGARGGLRAGAPVPGVVRWPRTAAVPESVMAEDDPLERLRALCLALPEATERLSHGEPTWFVRGKTTFVMYADHHHDDRLAFWCAAPDGAQEALVASDPERYFRPPYVGHRGWLGVCLDVPVDWDTIADLSCPDSNNLYPRAVGAEQEPGPGPSASTPP